jgi:sortase A
MAVGRILLVAGVLILLFIPYLLWGTGLSTARNQSLLRQQFKADLHRAGAITPSTLPKTSQPTLEVAPPESAPALGSAVGTIDIPLISLSMVVVEGTADAQLALGPGHYPGTPLPGEAGNSAIAGHRTTYLHPFYDLNEVTPGTPIYIITTQGDFQYDVTSQEVVSPNDVSVVNQTTTPQLTLTTCNPRYSATQRLVVHAVLVAGVLNRAAPETTTDPVRPKPSHAKTPTPPARSWSTAILWGVAVAAGITAIWIGARRTHRGTRALLLGGGLVVWLVVVFYFFQSVAPLLPASY